MTPRPISNPLNRFLILFALAYAGGVALYGPFLSLLLPLRVTEIAGAARLGLLVTITMAGAVAASASNILFGWLSDRERQRRGDRRGWMTAGLVLTLVSYAGIAAATGPATLLVAVVAYQLVLNALLAPLMASMADTVPDEQKGLAGGLLALAQPVAAVSGAVVLDLPVSPVARLAIIAVVPVILIVPLLLTRPPAIAAPVAAAPKPAKRRSRIDMTLIWTSRLLIQIACNVMFAFALFLLGGILHLPISDAFAARVGRITAVALFAALPISLLVGAVSDRLRLRKHMLLLTAVLAAASLLTVAAAGDGWIAMLGYAAFIGVATSFLGLHSAYTMQMLPSPRHHGRDLGLINLANTIPALLGPLLTWGMARTTSYGSVLAMLAALTLLAGLLILPTREDG
ncbi:MFS transporter [Sphingomonas sp. KR1UV-12]|uniref:MFS transporter n=1 Tax=Sphingomonas aurea TaxID=3063994 RepID=A0ABT9EKS4_9SPHN|nr:MFS transporter [Sphingomonas sp. KR1UV-12]MDP1027573.1 MFS transporter [Sphingomonas sp. KR1UV-12]